MLKKALIAAVFSCLFSCVCLILVVIDITEPGKMTKWFTVEAFSILDTAVNFAAIYYPVAVPNNRYCSSSQPSGTKTLSSNNSHRTMSTAYRSNNRQSPRAATFSQRNYH